MIICLDNYLVGLLGGSGPYPTVSPPSSLVSSVADSANLEVRFARQLFWTRDPVRLLDYAGCLLTCDRFGPNRRFSLVLVTIADLYLNRTWFSSRSRTVARLGELHAPKWAYLGLMMTPWGVRRFPPYQFSSRLSFSSFFIRLRYFLSLSLCFSLFLSVSLSRFLVLDFENVVGR